MDQLRLRSAVQGIVCLIFALGSASTLAQSNVAIYGIADAGLELSNHGKGSLTRVVSGGQFASRLGFRGSEDLGDGLAALFRLEMGLNLDDGTLGQGGRIFGREAIVGLRSSRWEKCRSVAV